jgi:hypothetical protein
MGILPHFRRPDHRDLHRSDVLLRCGGIGRAFCTSVLAHGRRAWGTSQLNRPPGVNLWLTMAGHDRPHGMVGIRRRAEQGRAAIEGWRKAGLGSDLIG